MTEETSPGESWRVEQPRQVAPGLNSGDLSLRQAKLLNEVKAEISVELGEIVLSADQLIDLVPGSVLEFAVDAQRPLTLRLYGELLGTGVVVRNGEELGLEILSLAATAEETFGENSR